MSTRSSTKTSEPKFKNGTLVSVMAGSFDDESSENDDKWSSKFDNGSTQELFGVVDRVFATRCDVYFFDDKLTTKVNIEHLVVKSEQQLVVLADGSEWKREGFCRLIPFDIEASQSTGKDLKRRIEPNPCDSTFDFENASSIVIKNKTAKRKAASTDVLTLNPPPSKKNDICDKSRDVSASVPSYFQMPWDKVDTATASTPSSSSALVAATAPSDENFSVQSLVSIPQDTAQVLIDDEVAGPSTDLSPLLLSVHLPISVNTASNAPKTVARTRLKKLPLYKRPVKNLVEAENPSNYDLKSQEHLPESVVKAVIRQGKGRNAPTRTLTFSTKRNTNTRRSLCDFVVGAPGPRDESKTITEPLDGFDYFFPRFLQMKIVSFVNERILSTLKSLTGK